MYGPQNVKQLLLFVTSAHFMEVSASLHVPPNSTSPVSIDREAGWTSQPVQKLLEKTKAVSASGELLNKAPAGPNVCLMFNNSDSGFTEFEPHSRYAYTRFTNCAVLCKQTANFPIHEASFNVVKYLLCQN